MPSTCGKLKAISRFSASGPDSGPSQNHPERLLEKRTAPAEPEWGAGPELPPATRQNLCAEVLVSRTLAAVPTAAHKHPAVNRE